MTVSVVKSLDESIVNSIALQDDDELFVTIPANETWLVEIGFFPTSISANPDLKFTVAADGASGRWAQKSSAFSFEFGAVAAAALFPNAILLLQLTAVVINGGSPTTVKLQWAPVNLDPLAALTVKAGSFLLARKLA